MAGKLTQKIVDQWLAAAWQDGFTKGEAGSDDKPDFASMDPRGSIPPPEKADPADAAIKPYDDTKCSARIWNGGHGAQCSRAHLDDCVFCKAHNMKPPAFGRYNGERPTRSLDKDTELVWADMKAVRAPSSSSAKPKLKVSDLRNYLATRIPNETIKGLKKLELQAMYDKLKSESPDSDSDEPVEEPVMPHPPIEDPIEQPVEQPVEVAVEQPIEDPIEESVEQPIEQPAEVAVEQPAEVAVEVPAEVAVEVAVEQPVEVAVEQPVEVEQPAEEDDPKFEGCGSDTAPEDMEPEPEPEPVQVQESTGPSSVKEYKVLFDNLGIEKPEKGGKVAYKALHAKYLADIALKATDDDSDAEDEDLEEDKCYDEISFEGIEYLEDENNGDIYDFNHVLVGKWNLDSDDIIWSNEVAKVAHECNKD